MKRLVSTLNLSKEDWLRYRKCGITGTDAGAILGVNPYRSAFQVCLCVTSAQNSRWSAMMKANYWNCRRTGCSGAAQIIWLVLVSSPEQTVRAT